MNKIKSFYPYFYLHFSPGIYSLFLLVCKDIDRNKNLVKIGKHLQVNVVVYLLQNIVQNMVSHRVKSACL